MNSSFPRILGAVTCLALGALLGGCGTVTMPSLPTTNTQAVQTRTFRDEPDVIYAASRAALEAMNYTHVRGTRGTGRLEMASRVLPGSALLARQRQVKITVSELETGETELQIAIWESSEEESAGGTRTATNRLLRDGTAYDVFWGRLNDQLKALPVNGPATP